MEEIVLHLGPANIPPHTVVTVQSSPKHYFQPTEMLCEESIKGSLCIVDLFVGYKSQLAHKTPLSMYETFKNITLDACSTTAYVTFQIENTTDKACVFSATLRGGKS